MSSRIFNFYAGELLRLALIFAGIVLIIRSVKSEPRQYSSGPLSKTGCVSYGRRGRYCALTYVLPHPTNTLSEEEGCRSRHLVDYLILGILPLLMIWEVFSVIIYVPPSFSGFGGMIFTHILLSGVILGLLGRIYLKKWPWNKISLGYADFRFLKE